MGGCWKEKIINQVRTGDKPRLGMEDRRCEEKRGGLNSRGHRSQQKRTEVWRREAV